MSGLLDKTAQALQASANFRTLRNRVTASNIANAETPGYTAKVVDFEEALSRAIDHEGMGKVHADGQDHFLMGQGAISHARADVYDNPDINVTNDKNTVDMEKEMAALSENTILYKAAIQLINKKLGSLKYAITEGGGR